MSIQKNIYILQICLLPGRTQIYDRLAPKHSSLYHSLYFMKTQVLFELDQLQLNASKFSGDPSFHSYTLVSGFFSSPIQSSWYE